MKRPRESDGPDLALIEVYDGLASVDEDVRLRAASALLNVHVPNADQPHLQTILTRLFRGLCSGRKAARVGFSIALTEVLYYIKSNQSEDSISPSTIVSILVKQTKPDSNTTGQDERDHYFGRLFGSEAIIKAELLFAVTFADQWDRLLDIICTIALQKPWIRQSCGWVLYDCVRTYLNQADREQLAVRILEKLNEHKLIRSPEGLAVWLEVRRQYPKASLPKNVWKNNDPLSRKDLKVLADVLKDAKASSKSDGGVEVQGSAGWAANLHFIWDVVLAEIFPDDLDRNLSQHDFFRDFWQIAVDEALFAAANSQERKYWGLLVMQKTLDMAAPSLADVIFSKNATSCLIQSIKTDDSYLQRTAQNVIQRLQKCVAQGPAQADCYVLAFIQALGTTDFDALTRTKTLEGLLAGCDPEALTRVAATLSHYLLLSQTSEGPDAISKRKLVLNQESKLINQQVNRSIQNDLPLQREAIYAIFQAWMKLISPASELDAASKKIVLEKTQLAFEQVLKLGRDGRAIILDLVEEIYESDPISSMGAEDDVVSMITAGSKRFRKLKKQVKGHSEASIKSVEKGEGLALLYGLMLFEIFSGDTEAIQILQELLDSEVDAIHSKKPSEEAVDDNADTLVEILLSFASRPSKFLRRITLIIFDTFTSHLTRDGIQSLTAILETKETKAGQQELFESNGDTSMLEGVDDENEEVEEDSDVEMLDSDVEVVSASESGSDSDSESDSKSEASNEESSDEDETDIPNAELAALEASLASALGTRKLTQADMNADTSSSDSDSDMSDSEMIELDEKLAEVFRHRANATKQTKKKEQKSAKDNIINFKNRILDMLEVYVKKENTNSRSLDLILPVLHLARSTNTKQLADKAIKLLTTYSQRCSGLAKVPVLPAPVEPKPKSKSKKRRNPSPSPTPSSEPETTPDHTTTTTLALLHAIHAEAGLANTSNAHRAVCSKTSTLVVKTLLKAGVGIAEIEAIYAAFRVRMVEDDTCHVHKGFFEDWDNWRNSVRGKV